MEKKETWIKGIVILASSIIKEITSSHSLFAKHKKDIITYIFKKIIKNKVLSEKIKQKSLNKKILILEISSIISEYFYYNYNSLILFIPQCIIISDIDIYCEIITSYIETIPKVAYTKKNPRNNIVREIKKKLGISYILSLEKLSKILEEENNEYLNNYCNIPINSVNISNHCYTMQQNNR